MEEEDEGGKGEIRKRNPVMAEERRGREQGEDEIARGGKRRLRWRERGAWGRCGRKN